MSTAEDIELQKSFFMESMDILDRIDGDITNIKNGNSTTETINALFRGLHTIKGNSSFLNLDNITRLSHTAEALLDMVRKKQIPITTVVLEMVHAVAEHLRQMIEEQNTDLDVSKIINDINKFMRGERAISAQSPIQSAGKASGASTKLALAPVIRVDEAKLNRILSLVSELELSRYTLEKIPEKMDEVGLGSSELRSELDATVAKVSRLTKSLSSIVLGVRLVPVNRVFQRFPRVVKDLAQKLGKNIQLQIMNGDAELDKNIVEAIADPMTHLIRNAADHGIESSVEREKNNKNPVGTIRLNSYVQGNFVFIEIADDGGGIDGGAVLKKAIEKGIVSADKAASFNHMQKLGLIFAPGFSTAETVTDISGRGVGMDVVKASINKMKGTVLIDSRVGKGTVIQLRFPMSVVVLFSLFVSIHQTMCAFPVDQVDESYDFDRDALLAKIPEEDPDKEKYLALYSIDTLLWRRDISQDNVKKYHVLRFKGKKAQGMGFIVDDFTGIEDAMVQSVDSYISALPGIQGATIRKDGSVSLVLNAQVILALAKKSKPFAYVKIQKGEASEVDLLLQSHSNTPTLS